LVRAEHLFITKRRVDGDGDGWRGKEEATSVGGSKKD
jgi:hypothetical protein